MTRTMIWKVIPGIKRSENWKWSQPEVSTRSFLSNTWYCFCPFLSTSQVEHVLGMFIIVYQEFLLFFLLNIFNFQIFSLSVFCFLHLRIGTETDGDGKRKAPLGRLLSTRRAGKVQGDILSKWTAKIKNKKNLNADV